MTAPPARRWVVLSVALVGLVAGCAAQYGLAYLIPALRAEGLSLESATAIVIAPVFGILLSLIAWGAAADRWGERVVLTAGLTASGLALLGAAAATGSVERWVWLFLAGASGASIHSASGRLILGWFSARERGLAMGIRQTGQPLGVAVAALALPALAVLGVGVALAALAIGCLASAIVVVAVVRDPQRPPSHELPRTPSPYRSAYLWRIHAASAMLVIPQFAVAVFAFDYLVTAVGWSITVAGTLLAATQLLGAGSRMLVGFWSDRVAARLAPMRRVAVAIGLVMATLAALAMLGAGASVAALALAAVITVSPNGLAFTAVAERAGATWAGRALGVQNTFQNLVAAAVATPLAVVISSLGGGMTAYGAAFGIVVVFPFLAAAVIPAHAEAARSLDAEAA